MILRRATPVQSRIANTLGLEIEPNSFEISAAIIRDAIAEAVGEEPPMSATVKQEDFAASLGEDVSNDTKRVASAKIDDALWVRNQTALGQLQLKPGDRVIRVTRVEYGGETHVLEREFVVSSIHPNGRVYFKGGGGQGAWPSQVRKAGGS